MTLRLYRVLRFARIMVSSRSSSTIMSSTPSAPICLTVFSREVSPVMGVKREGSMSSMLMSFKSIPASSSISPEETYEEKRRVMKKNEKEEQEEGRRKKV